MRLPNPISIMQGFVDAVNRHEMTEVATMFDDDATLSVEPPLPRSPKRAYNGRGEIEKWLGQLMAEHLEMTASNFEVAGNKVTWDVRLSADRFAEMGVDPLQARARTELDGSQIQSMTFDLTPESVRKVESVTAAAR